MSEYQAQFEQIMSQVPAGVNPWIFLSAALKEQVMADSPESFRVQLYVLSGFLVIVPLTLAASLLVRYRQRNLWFIRIMKTSRGGNYLTPHYLSTWSLLMIVFYAVLIFNVYRTIAYSNGEVVRSIGYIKTLSWLPAWCAFWFASISFAITQVLHLDSSGRAPTSAFTSAPFLNTVTIGVPLAMTASIVTLSVFGTDEYHTVLDTFTLLEAGLMGAAKSYNGTVDASLIQTGVSTASVMFKSLHKFVDYFRACFIAYAAFTGLMEILFAVVSMLHLRELRRSLSELQTKTRSTPEAKAQEQILLRTYNQLLAVTYLMFLCLTVFNIVFIFVAVAADKTILSTEYSEAGSLLAPYLFSVIGLPISILIFKRALADASNRTDLRSASKSNLHQVASISRQSLKSRASNRSFDANDVIAQGAVESFPLPILQQSLTPPAEKMIYVAQPNTAFTPPPASTAFNSPIIAQYQQAVHRQTPELIRAYSEGGSETPPTFGSERSLVQQYQQELQQQRYYAPYPTRSPQEYRS